MDRKRILNISIDNISEQELLEKLTEGFVVTPNVDHLVKLQKDKEFYDVYESADIVICDSKILALAFKFLGTPIKEAIPGSSFFSHFYEYHKDNENLKVFLLGAAEGVALKAQENINKKVGRDIIVGAHSPSYGFEKNEEECMQIIDIINSSSATVLLVGVGAPKQEKWIYKYKDKLHNIKIFLPLGATIDFEAGYVKRAPIIFQKLALEWLYRICQDPKRLISRYLVDDVIFFKYLIQQKLKLYRNPF
ncbi:WecB/TagA/CpsF family glycosyltransferase [Dysgonomonas sp. Marseille-P4361]|uniref:WecB/TagA/CpsF family glycosyltransferase n=1 Tax=Dysgonomonas sp. Marseille-P4361 TaxID=2161820 RepID=UPI000D552BDE|nr:WecB/TagA/CpsF family glycosyltransferase [Dysgonomonas sp. Marseille-P4361]